jgi:3,4-dihydroxy 2-butanone 4-phosphate synthase/GTP cyclohydrolase II
MRSAEIERAIAATAAGELVIIVDHRENAQEGVLAMAAEKVMADKVAFMVRYTSGLVYLPMPGERLDELGILPASSTPTSSVDLVDTRGISAEDRARAIHALVDPATRPGDLKQPGHVFPVRYRQGGVLAWMTPMEAAADLARLAGSSPIAAVGEMVSDDGSAATTDHLLAFAEEHALTLITIRELAAYRWRNEKLVLRAVETTLPTDHGVFKAVGYQSQVDGSEHIALVYGNVAGAEDVLTRVHSRCLTGDVLGSRRCDCGPQLAASMARIAEEGAGIITYNETHEGRGIGLLEKLRAYRLQDEGRDTVDANLELGFPADGRHYGVEAQILTDLQVTSVRLMTNNPNKIRALQRYGIAVSGREPLVVGINGDNRAYMTAKVDRLGHLVGHTEIP